MAVATRITNNRGSYNIGYRFFWLDKNITLPNGKKTEIDGIGTLISWWHSAGEPKYYLNEPQNQPIDLNRYPVTARYSSFCDRYFPLVQHLVTDEENIPRNYLAQKQANGTVSPHYLAFHSLINYAQKEIQFKQRYHAPVAWAWNVRWLEHTDFFSFILNTDAKAQKYNDLQPFKRVYNYYEFSQSDYWGYIGENVNVEIKRINPLPGESEVTLVLADGTKTSIKFAANSDTETIPLTPLKTTSSIRLENPSLGKLGAIVTANIRPCPVYDFTQTTTFNGQIGQSINLIVSRKGDLSQPSSVRLMYQKVNSSHDSNSVFFPNQNQSPQIITFNPNESQKPLSLQIPEDTTQIILQADNPKQIGINSTATIIPENDYEFAQPSFKGYVNQVLPVAIIRKGDTTQASTIYTKWQGFDGIVDKVKFNVGEKSKIIPDWRTPDQDAILELYQPTSGRIGTQNQCQIDVKEYYHFEQQGYCGEYGEKVTVKIVKVGNLHKQTEFILQDEKTRKARSYAFPAHQQKITKEIKVDDEQGFTLHIKPSQWENPPIPELVTSTFIYPLTLYWLSDDIYAGYYGQKVTVTVYRKYCSTEATIAIENSYSGNYQPVHFPEGKKEKSVNFDVGKSDFEIRLREPEYGLLVDKGYQAKIQSHPIYEFSQKIYKGIIGENIEITINRIGNLSGKSEILFLFNDNPYKGDGIQNGIIVFTNNEKKKTIKIEGNVDYYNKIEIQELQGKYSFDKAKISIFNQVRQDKSQNLLPIEEKKNIFRWF